MYSNDDPSQILRAACEVLLSGHLDNAQQAIRAEYPFKEQPTQARKYTERQKLALYARDGFIDRYTGKRLVYIGILRLFSALMPTEFPYHPNWKIESCHPAYWELTPTLDHIIPVTRGGSDEPENWATTSMVSNAAKANWTLEELGWKLLPPGNLAEWDGLVNIFIRLVRSNPSFSEDK